MPALRTTLLRAPRLVSSRVRGWVASPGSELVALFAASCAVVAILVLAVAAGTVDWLSGAKIRLVLMTCIAGGLLIAGALLLGLPQMLLRPEAWQSAEVGRLRHALQTAEAVIHAEPQILVFWERGQRVRIVAQTLTGVPGLPADGGALESFGDWLDAASAQELRSGLDRLFAEGQAFNLLVRTRAGAHLEADGRAGGGRAILRLRDVVGHRRDLARLLDQHRGLTREIQAGRTLLEALPMPVWLASDSGRITWANAAYLKAVSASQLSDVHDTPVELLESRQRERAKTALAKGAAYRERQPLVVDGEIKAHDVVVLPVEGGAAGAAIDRTAIESAQVETGRQSAAYDRVLQRVATGIAVYGRDQRLSFFNEAYLKIWQVDADWLGQKPSVEETLDRLRSLSRLPQVVNYRDWKAKVLSGMRDGAVYEDWWHLLDGRTIHVIAESRPDGGVTYIYDDVSQRLALESKFNAMIDTQRETLDSLKEGVAVFAPDGRLQLYNKAFARVWRLSRQMLSEGPHIDTVIGQARVLHDDPEMWQAMGRAVTGISDRRSNASGQLERADQSVIDYAVSPLPDGATLITFADVTDARRAERALIERNDALVAADRLKSQFIRHVSYELRTPLNTIIGYTEFMQSPYVGPLNDKQTEYLGDIEASSKTLLSIINDILDLATIDAGSLELKVAPVAVQPVISAAILGVRDRASRTHVTVAVDVAGDVDTFAADEQRVRQVLYNLLSNAIGFSKAGDTVRVGCWRERGMLVFAIEDQGSGIPRDQQARVFDRFESKSYGSKHRGAGLGLSIVKSLVELHGGNVSFDSEPGAGTRVTVRFPEMGIAVRRLEQKVA